jgi:hypothetical protein
VTLTSSDTFFLDTTSQRGMSTLFAKDVVQMTETTEEARVFFSQKTLSGAESLRRYSRS